MSDTKKGCGEVGCDPAACKICTSPGIPEARHPNPVGTIGNKALTSSAMIKAFLALPASPAGLEPGDIITNSLSQPVGMTFRAVEVALQQREAEVTARVKRETRERIVKALRERGARMPYQQEVLVYGLADFISTLELE